MDEYFSNHHADYFIKIDVQGAEGAVLKGARQTLKSAPRVIVVVEFWPKGMELSGIGASEALKTLKECGLNFVYILEERTQKWGKTTIDKFEEFYKAHEKTSIYACFSKGAVKI